MCLSGHDQFVYMKPHTSEQFAIVENEIFIYTHKHKCGPHLPLFIILYCLKLTPIQNKSNLLVRFLFILLNIEFGMRK